MLFVLYDAACGFCVQCRHWLARQEAWVELVPVRSDSDDIDSLFPDLRERVPIDDLLVVDDQGAVYVGAAAWLMCLWALVRYREWALRLASGGALPWARMAFESVSGRRRRISRFLGWKAETDCPTCTPSASPDPAPLTLRITPKVPTASTTLPLRLQRLIRELQQIHGAGTEERRRIESAARALAPLSVSVYQTLIETGHHEEAAISRMTFDDLLFGLAAGSVSEGDIHMLSDTLEADRPMSVDGARLAVRRAARLRRSGAR